MALNRPDANDCGRTSSDLRGVWSSVSPEALMGGSCDGNLSSDSSDSSGSEPLVREPDAEAMCRSVVDGLVRTSSDLGEVCSLIGDDARSRGDDITPYDRLKELMNSSSVMLDNAYFVYHQDPLSIMSKRVLSCLAARPNPESVLSAVSQLPGVHHTEVPSPAMDPKAYVNAGVGRRLSAAALRNAAGQTFLV